MDDHLPLEDAIAAQPEWMARAATLVAEALAEHPVARWAPAETVAVIGMGASTHAGAVFTEALRARGQRAVNLDASAAARFPDGFSPAEHVIVISESGRSPEPILAAQRLPERPVVITNDPVSPLAELGSPVIPLGGFTDSGVYTIGYTTTLVALAALAGAHGVPLADPASLADVAARALADAAEPGASLAAALDRCTFLDLVGQGVSYGGAQAGALLFREATHLATAAYDTLQYLHGPMECCGPTAAVLMFGDGRERPLAEQLEGAGVLTHRLVMGAGVSGPGVTHIGVPGAPDGADYPAAVGEIVFAQVVAAALATRRGITVGDWRFPQPDTKLPPASYFP